MPGDRETLALLSQVASSSGDFKQSAAYAKQIIDSGRGLPQDFNTFGWDSLLAGANDTQVEETVARGVQLSKTQNPSLLHTLASMYAESGKTREARQLILKAMDDWRLEEPDSNSWYVFARIAEQYGLDDVAAAAYKRVEKPEEAWMTNVDCYALAQHRLAALKPGLSTQRPAK
jgi:predicted Zn-dependent protease